MLFGLIMLSGIMIRLRMRLMRKVIIFLMMRISVSFRVSKGLIGLHVNWTKGLARFGLGLPAGIFAAGGEAKLAGEETIKAPRQAAAGIVSSALTLGTLGAVDQDKAKKAIENVIGHEERDWGDGVDFQIGDAIWADYAKRYYDPFAYEVDENGIIFWMMRISVSFRVSGLV